MLKKIVIGAAAVGTLIWIISMMVLTLASDETRIGWLLEGMAEDFNAGEAAALCSGLADGFREAETGMERREIALALISIFRQERRADGSFPYRAEIPRIPGPGAELKIAAAGADSPTAELRLRVRFFRQPAGGGRDAEAEPMAVVEFEANLVVEDGEWKVLEARRKTIEGQLPF